MASLLREVDRWSEAAVSRRMSDGTEVTWP